MTDIRESLLDAYAKELGIASSGFEMMGKLLDAGYIRERVNLLGVSELYVYGGGYLGIQFYHAVSDLVHIPAIIDKKERLLIDLPEIPVIGIERFKEVYEGQKVVIASVRFYHEIKKELSAYLPESQIIFLGEFLGGILK